MTFPSTGLAERKRPITILSDKPYWVYRVPRLAGGNQGNTGKKGTKAETPHTG